MQMPTYQYKRVGVRTYEVLVDGLAKGVVWHTSHGWSGRLMPPSPFAQFERTAGKSVVAQKQARRFEVAQEVVAAAEAAALVAG